MTNPSLSSSLRADYEALQNDVEQAQELAAEFQRQLAGKSNEVAEFKQIFEKTQKDLARLQASITELREERHRLANEAMRAMALERRLAEVTAERDRLIKELTLAKQAASKADDESDRRLLERDAQIARLSLQLTELRENPRVSLATVTLPASAGKSASVKVVLSDMWRTLEQLQKILDPTGASAKSTSQGVGTEEFIDIAFER